MQFIKRYCIKAVKYCSLYLTCVLSLFWCSERAQPSIHFFVCDFSINWILSHWQMTEILLDQFCIFLTNERCDWFSLSTFTLSIDLGSNLFYLVAEFLFSETGASFEQLVPQPALSTVLLIELGIFVVLFFSFFKLLTVLRNVNLHIFSQGQHEHAHEYKLSKGSSSIHRTCHTLF